MEAIWQEIRSKNCVPILSEYFKQYLAEHQFDVANIPTYNEKTGTPRDAHMAWSIGGDGT